MFGEKKTSTGEEAVRDYAQLLVDCGFYGQGNYRTEVIRHFLDYDFSPGEEQKFDHLIDDIYERRLREQLTWGETIADRLEAAFADLRNDHNIVDYLFLEDNQSAALQHIYRQKNVLLYAGFLYFTREDAKQAVMNAELPVSYGAYGRAVDELSHVRIGRVIADGLIDHGFDVQWDGKYGTPLRVKVPHWRRRLDPNATWAGIHDEYFLYEPEELKAMQQRWATENPNEARGYVLENAVLRAAEHPDTFQIPHDSWRSNLWIGEGVKLIFLPLVEEDYESAGERMWVRVVDLTRPDYIVGELWNTPQVFEHLQHGEKVYFRPENIVDIASDQVGEILE